MRNESTAQRRTIETWFRRRGLPMVVLRQVRAKALVKRTVPAQMFVYLIDLMDSILVASLDLPENVLNQRLADPGFLVGVLALMVGTVALPVLGAWAASRWLRCLDTRGDTVLAWSVVVFGLVVLSPMKWLTGLTTSPVEDTIGLCVIVAALLLLTFVGVGSIFTWAMRSAVRQLGATGTMISRALPLLVVIIVFPFLSAEPWQVADRLNRPRLWMVVGAIAVLSAVFLLAALRDELRTAGDRLRGAEVRDHADLLRSTPLDGLVPNHDGSAVRHYPLTRFERLNVVLVVFFAQAMQVAMFGVLVFVFFVIFGLLALDQGLVEIWVEHPVATITWFELELPVSNQLVQLAILLSAISSISFSASTVTDPNYRKSFFDPLLAQMSVSLSARDVYLTRWLDAPPDRAVNLDETMPIRLPDKPPVPVATYHQDGTGH